MKVYKTILASLLLLALWGCGSVEDSMGGRLLRLNMQSEPMSMDPAIGGEQRSQILLTMLFDTLMHYGPEGKLVAGVAESVDVSDDYRHYTFHLRESFWSNGLPVTAQDFVYAWERVIVPDSESFYGYAFYPLKNAQAIKERRAPLSSLGVHAPDRLTLEVELEYTAPYFLELTANPVYSPVSRAVVSRNPRWARECGEDYISNGAFRLKSIRRGDLLVLEKNPHFWAADQVRLDGIKTTFIQDPSSTLSSFELGELDFCGEPLAKLPLSALPVLAQDGSLESKQMGGLFWYEFNTQRPPFTNKKIRQAFSLAIDRKSIVDHVLHGRARTAASIVPSVFDLSDASVDYDPDRARALLAEGLEELGLSSSDLPKVTLSYGHVEGHKAYAQVCQAQWREILGWEVALQGMDWQVYLDSLFHHQFDIGGCAWYSWYRDPIYNLQCFKEGDGRMNGAAWDSPEYRALLNASEHSLDAEERWEYLRQAEAIISEEVPVTPVFESAYQYLQSPNLHGVVISDLGLINFNWAVLD